MSRRADSLPWDWRPESYWRKPTASKGDGSWTRGKPTHAAGLVGEYLPPLEPGEVEILLIKLASVSGDVISWRARINGDRIDYRAVDEYELEVALVPHEPGAKPLTFRELTTMAWEFSLDDSEPFIRSTWESEIEDGLDHDELEGSLAFTSDFYPSLQGWYETMLGQWLDGKT